MWGKVCGQSSGVCGVGVGVCGGDVEMIEIHMYLCAWVLLKYCQDYATCIKKLGLDDMLILRVFRIMVIAIR